MSGAGERRRLGLGEALGIELEYMVVDGATLAVRPIVDRLLLRAAGRDPDVAAREDEPEDEPEVEAEVERDALAWSNELALHVVELKTNGTVRAPRDALAAFSADVRAVNALLQGDGARLLPGAMHPLMDPDRELRLWPHEYRPVYEAFHRIFDCRGHGWANLQSMHLNLPFADDAEFGRLHAAIRAALPLLPALAAASPMLEGRRGPSLDMRLEVYGQNARRVPEVMGRVIPEACFDERSYREAIFAPMYRAIAPQDPEGVLQHEWLNARGAIARFGRGAIEIRVIDIQEHPLADLAVAEMTCALVRALCEERWASLAALEALPVDRLARVYAGCVRDADEAIVDDAGYLEVLGWRGGLTPSAREVWSHLAERLWPAGDGYGGDDASLGALERALALILARGPLARRLAEALGDAPAHERVLEVYGQLADGLQAGVLFEP